MNLTSTRITAMNRNDLVAAAFAEEGAEMIRNIRDTNLLRFASKAADCWRTHPIYSDLDTCANPGKEIAQGSYRVGINVVSNALPVALSAASDSGIAPLDANNPNAWYQLKLDDANTNLYNYFRGTATIFYREVKISYSAADPNVMNVISTVVYRSGKDPRVLTRSMPLTNHPYL